MYAIRQIQQVENGKVTVYLPADFTAQQVEVIVLPVEATNGHAAPAPVDQPNELLQRILAWDTSKFDADQMKAYHRLCEIARKWKPGDPPVFGAFEGLVRMADDFNTMSEEELDLFYADINTVDLEKASTSP